MHTNSDQQNTKQKTKDQTSRTPLSTRGELRCSGRVSGSCSTGGTRGVTLVTSWISRTPKIPPPPRTIWSVCRNYNQVLFKTYDRVCKKSNTTGSTCGPGTAYSSGEPEFISCFQWGSYCPNFSFLCNVL